MAFRHPTGRTLKALCFSIPALVISASLAIAESARGDDKKPVAAEQPASAAPNDEAAEAALKGLTERMGKDDPEDLRQQLLKLRRTYPGTAQTVKAAALLRQLPSPLDKLSASAIPAVERYDWQPKELVAVLGEHRGRNAGAAECLAYLPDGKSVISGGNNSTLRFWDPASMRLQRILHHSHYIHAAAVSRDGKTLACGGEDGLVRLWDLTGKEPKERGVLKGLTASPVHALAFSPSGKKIAWNGEGGTVRLWDVSGKEPKEQEVLGGHDKTVRAVAFSADGTTLATAGEDQKVRLWDLTKSPAKSGIPIPAHNKEVYALAFSPRGKILASGDLDGALWVWSVNGTRASQRAALKMKGIYSLTFSPNGKLLAAGCADGAVHLYDTTTPRIKERTEFEAHAGVVYSLAFAPDSRALATGSSDCTVRLWQLVGQHASQHTVTKGHLCHAYVIALTPDSKMLASGGADTTIRLWDLNGSAAKEKSVLKPAASSVLGLDFSSDGKMFASAHYDLTVRIWRLAGEREVRKISGFKDPIYCLAFAPSGNQIVTGAGRYSDGSWQQGQEPSLRLWDISSGREVRNLDGYKEPVRSVVFSPDGRRVLSGGLREELRFGKYVPVDCTVRLWDAEAGTEVGRMQQHSRYVSAVAFSADGQRCVSSSPDGTVLVWTPGKAKPVPLQGVTEYVSALAVAPDGQTFAGMGAYGKIYLWDAATGKKLRDWQLLEGATSIAFASDSRHLALSILGGPIYILRIAPFVKHESTLGRRVPETGVAIYGSRPACANPRLRCRWQTRAPEL